MPDDTSTKESLVFQALLKEAEFLRSETLLCIDYVRKLTIYSTSIAGFTLPVIGSFIGIKEESISLMSPMSIVNAIEKNHLIIQFICLGSSLTCVAFLRIYLGVFMQIFTFAKYFRVHISPYANEKFGNGDGKIFYWEDWLKTHRKKKSLFIGDIDLAVEPILMSLYILLYGAIAVFIGWYFQSFPITSYIVGLSILLIIENTIMKFIRILKDSTD